MTSNIEIFKEIAKKYNIPINEDMGGVCLLLDNGYTFSTYYKITGKIFVSKDYSYNPIVKTIFGYAGEEVLDISKFESELKESLKLYKAAKEKFKFEKMQADFD